jgi:predicted aminopeptidase
LGPRHFTGSRFLIAALLLALLVTLDGCYYLQAARGQLDLMSRRRPLAEMLADASSPEELRQRLQVVKEARDFAVAALGLPDNESYRSYADLGRDYVVWNVFAAPEFSLEPKQWCYPVAGCVAYRGYFSEAAASKLAGKLNAKGFDVVVGGVPAYSTLGRFADPVLNTMLRWTDDDLVATLFHELAHQKLYVKGDTQFNESFATAVAETGLQRWRNSRGEKDNPDGRARRRYQSKAVQSLVTSVRDQLQALYSSGLEEQTMRARKKAIFDTFAKDAVKLAPGAAAGGSWLGGTLNNARLASIGLYEGRVAAFAALLQQCNEDLDCFYRQAEMLADLEKDTRNAELDRLTAASGAGFF